MTDYEKLGAFYLGREHRPELPAGERPLVLYDARDLTTHAVCVGMTGSGKTGLCLGLLEEAALDGVPAIAIDPKGDLGNLLLAFPELRPADFRPWIDEQEAARRGVTPDAFAAEVATRWRDGLAEWGQGPERIARFRQSAEVVIYTPGGDAGVPLAALRSLAPPPPAVMQDAAARRDRLGATVAGLLTLLGREVDPVGGRDHVLLSVLLEQAWADGRNVTLETLIADVQRPPLERIGVVAVDAFVPPAERMALAMALNTLLASPGFAAWRRGEPLDVARLLYASDGRPRISIVSIAHLTDRERMFLVTLLLGEVVSWMRLQPGTGSLRAILYMDEVFGYLPPTAEPPSKRALLTLLKQARAYGLGVVLATQNPVDLDYKALGNAGTWLVGRLQTERDKARLLDGLTSAASGGALDRARLDTMLSSLGTRVFLLHDVHADAPVLMETRWALSYLRGPLTGAQIATLMADQKAARAEAAPAVPSGDTITAGAPGTASARPALEPGVPELFLTPGEPAPTRYRPHLLATARLHYVRASADLDVWRTVHLLAPMPASGGHVAWDEAAALGDEPSLDDAPRAALAFEDPAPAATRARSYRAFSQSLVAHLHRTAALTLWRSRDPKAMSRPEESEGAFRGRLLHLWREERDHAVEKLRRRYAPKLERCERAIRAAEARLERERAQYGHQRTQTAISFGATVLGALFGRKLGGVGRATTTARTASRVARERDDVARAEADLAEQRARLAALDAALQAELVALQAPAEPGDFALEEMRIAPRKADVGVERLALAWRPLR